MRQSLKQAFPDLDVVGETFPPTAGRVMLANAVRFAQFAALALMFAGPTIFTRVLGLAAPPDWYVSMAENKFSTGMMIWVFGNFLSGQLLQTGAFEMVLDGKDVLHSKIASGNVPSVDAVVRMLYDAGVDSFGAPLPPLSEF